MKILIIAIVACIIIIVGIEVARFFVLFSRSDKVVKDAVPYMQSPENPTTSVLVVGDSTGYGTGADEPKDSVAGRLGTLFPKATIENKSVNGQRAEGARATLEGLPENASYDLILLQIGGNDILQFTDRTKLRKEIKAVLETAKMHANEVVFMSTGNVGAAPAFFAISDFAYTVRTKQDRKIFIEEAKEAKVAYVDLYTDGKDDPFVQEPKKYHAADGLHPSSAGYELWFNELVEVLKKETIFYSKAK